MSEIINFDQFSQVELRVGKVLEVNEAEKSDKLLVLRVGFGELGERQVVAGLKKDYKPKDLLGKKLVFVMNLPVRQIFGYRSEAMILAADDGKDKVSVVGPLYDIKEGSLLR
ncbi:MAG: methionine--tRNA ligase subunit beta [bacterium]|nr:methionine--tRNA ligase subunit beta [bacterium]